MTKPYSFKEDRPPEENEQRIYFQQTIHDLTQQVKSKVGEATIRSFMVLEGLIAGGTAWREVSRGLPDETCTPGC